MDLISKKIYQDNHSAARSFIISTDHGQIHTPVFMPVGTLATVKGVFHKHLIDEVKAQIILGNTYHLYLRPGNDIIIHAGGLHKFMNWNKPILTDSGGYQVFSLSKNRKIRPEGVDFYSHIDGSKHFFTPQGVVDMQLALGSDFMMALDECSPYPCTKKYAQESMKLTHNWLKLGVEYYRKKSFLYNHTSYYLPIVQGSIYKELREESADFCASMDLPINAIGGLSVGEPEDEMYKMSEIACNILPSEKPRYLMGVGTPKNLLENIALGIDMFDCVMPTRNARNGQLFTYQGIINIKNKKWEKDFSPIDTQENTFVDTYYSKAYLRHLFISHEMLGAQIASLHNLAFYHRLMRDAQEQIKNATFYEWKNRIVKQLNQKL